METSSEPRRHVVDLGILRRVIHVALLIFMIAGVRACGGATQAEDRLGVATRWVAQKTGMSGAMTTWDTTIRPPIAAVTTKASNAVYDGVSRTLDTVQFAADNVATWFVDNVNKTVAAIQNRMRSTVTPSKDEPAEKPDSPNINNQTPSAR